MPLGILEDRHLEHVPGTSPLNELGHIGIEDTAGIDSNFLKHDPTGKIVLVPQPSDSPNDPYNWPKWKKRMFTVAIAYGCGCVGGMPYLFSLVQTLTQIERVTNTIIQRWVLCSQQPSHRLPSSSKSPCSSSPSVSRARVSSQSPSLVWSATLWP